MKRTPMSATHEVLESLRGMQKKLLSIMNRPKHKWAKKKIL